MGRRGHRGVHYVPEAGQGSSRRPWAPKPGTWIAGPQCPIMASALDLQAVALWTGVWGQWGAMEGLGFSDRGVF